MNLPRKPETEILQQVLYSNYEDQEKDLEELLVSFYFWSKWDTRIDEIPDEFGRKKAVAEARKAAIEQTSLLNLVSKKSLLMQLHKMNKDQWYRYLNDVEDVQSLQEYMEKLIENIESKGTRSETIRVINELIPAMEKLGVPAEDILTIPDNISKARGALPTMKRIYEKFEDEDVATEKTLDLFKDIVSDSTYKQFRKNNEVRLEEVKEDIVAQTGMYILPNSVLVVVECDDMTMAKAIEIKLDGMIAPVGVRDALYLTKYLKEQYYPEEKRAKLVAEKNDDNKYVMQFHNNGIPLPSIKEMEVIITQTIGHYSYVLERSENYITVPVVKFAHANYDILIKGGDVHDLVAALANYYEKSMPIPLLQAMDLYCDFDIVEYENGETHLVLQFTKP